MRGLYTVGIWFYCFGVHVAAACGHRNARLMLHGWHHWREELAKLDGRPVVWFHAASLGEFEQARPVLESYRERHPDHQVLLTFFSPSGYEVRKNYAKAEAVCYLPPDLPLMVHRFIRQTNNLQAAFFVKYDFWFNYLGALRKSHVPTYIFSAIFRPEQYFFKPWGRWFVRQLRDCFTHLFVQNEESLQLLRSHGIDHCSLAGDTRYDRVHQIVQTAERDAVVEKFLDGYDGKVLVAGSTWPPDEQLLAHLRESKQWFPERIIIAPHEIHEEHLRSIEALFTDSIRYSSLSSSTSSSSATSHVLIIDNIGLLSKLYRYATVAYIGGGFGVGIHNILEAVAYGKPVVFGPNYHKFQEAHDLIDLGGCMIVDEHPDVSFLRKLFTDDDIYHAASDACMQLMRRNLGSTTKIMDTIEK
ncbi:MAG: 3-deoxy-D-manno-octulosonic acid transferase [Bacteroidales bacterium]|nr:3-deoxy-D-manno-octulosonic acid transferase [Bacteroidales bacterium]